MTKLLLVCLSVCIFMVGGSTRVWAKADHVILLSIDGLRSDALTALDPALIPNFSRLMKEGAITLNARTDVDYTITLPNHTSMITSYPVKGKKGHGVFINDDSASTIHRLRGHYVSSIFDVLNKHRLPSMLASSKLKFKIFADSYRIGKVFLSDQNDNATILAVVNQLKQDPPVFIFMHLALMDVTGHQFGWSLNSQSRYMKQLIQMDTRIGYLMAVLDQFNTTHNLVLIITADHGGDQFHHADQSNPLNFTIPMIIWGKEIAIGQDLYRMNSDRRNNPGVLQVEYSQDDIQPIRNGEAANIALKLLGLECVKGSTIGCRKPLNVWQKKY